MTIHLACAQCGAKLKVKDEMAGKTGRCPTCKATMKIPAPEAEATKPAVETPAADFSAADQLFDEDFAKAPTLEEKAAAAAAEGGADANAPIPFDSLFDDDEPAPQIILAGGEKPGESSVAKSSAGEASPQAAAQPKPSQRGERIFDPGELPRALGKQNHYLVCDHKDVVARWENDGRGWLVHLKDGFTRAATVENQIPQFGNFILVEVGVERRDDGLHLKNITVWQLRRQYSLTKIAKGDDAILETIIDYAELNDRQRSHVKNLVKSKFLPHMWGEMEVMLGLKTED